nr:uncharacterized protein LOC112717887 [Arachis hypogaea]
MVVVVVVGGGCGGSGGGGEPQALTHPCPFLFLSLLANPNPNGVGTQPYPIAELFSSDRRCCRRRQRQTWVPSSLVEGLLASRSSSPRRQVHVRNCWRRRREGLLHRRLFSICWCPSLSSSSLSIRGSELSLSLSFSLGRVSLLGCGVFTAPSPSFLPRRRRMRRRTSQAIVFNKSDIVIVEHYNFYC